MESAQSGHVLLDGVGFTLELEWQSQDEQDLVLGTMRLRSTVGSCEEITRRVELLPRFPQMFAFQGAYIHLSLVACQSSRSLHISLPTPQSRQWRSVLAQWERPTSKPSKLKTSTLNMKAF